jgi:hypothetical protein
MRKLRMLMFGLLCSAAVSAPCGAWAAAPAPASLSPTLVGDVRWGMWEYTGFSGIEIRYGEDHYSSMNTPAWKFQFRNNRSGSVTIKWRVRYVAHETGGDYEYRDRPTRRRDVPIEPTDTAEHASAQWSNEGFS